MWLSILEPEGHDLVRKNALRGDKDEFLSICLMHRYLVITLVVSITLMQAMPKVEYTN